MGERADIMAETSSTIGRQAVQGEDKQYDELLKILVVGGSAVGKTQLVTRYTEDAFTDSGHATIGVDFKIKKTEIQSGDFKGTKLKLQIWDTAGQERFRNVNSSYYRGAHGMLVVYSVTDEDSFKKCDEWVQELQKHAGNGCLFMFIGNKIDLEGERKVSSEDAQSYASKYQKTLIETSAKANTNVEQAFETLAEQVLCKRKAELERSAAAQADADAEKRKQNAGPAKKENEEGCCTLL